MAIRRTPRTHSSARISAIGSYLPERCLSNGELAAMVDTSDEWIVQRTGITSRRVAAPDEFTSDLCVKALGDLAARFPKALPGVEYVIVATTTPDYWFPGVACQVQDRCGLQAGAIDINATCAGFVYAIELADALVSAGTYGKVLIVAADVLTKAVDYSDRTTCVLFGDGAAALVLERDEARPSVVATRMAADGSGAGLLYRTAMRRTLDGAPLRGDGRIVQNGPALYRWALEVIPRHARELLQAAGYTPDDLAWFVPHSGNVRIVRGIADRLGIRPERVLESVTHFGNTGSATIPLALDLAVRNGHLQEHQPLLLYGFGGGVVHAGALLLWRQLDETRRTSPDKTLPADREGGGQPVLF
jgi:3-oxoacyl-[acyl-carrier-protein] synthase-3